MQTLAFFQQHVAQQLGFSSSSVKRSINLLLVIFALSTSMTWAASTSTTPSSSGTSSTSVQTGNQTTGTGTSSSSSQNKGQSIDPNATGNPADGAGTGDDKPAQFPLPPVEIQPHQPLQNRDPIQPRQ